MATYTASNAIKKIATGDESGTWGDSTNNNADIIDRASNGFVAIALTGTSYTLPLSTTAVLSLGHYKAIRFHGTPGGTCTVTLEQDNKPRVYMIYNNTDESVIINQGSGSGTKVTIPTGDSAIVLADGTGTNANVIDFTGQITGLSLLTGITAGTVAASKAVVVDANKDITGFRNVTSTGTVTAATLAIGSASLVEAELEMLDGVTAGTVAASKVAVVDANKDITGFRNVTSTGTVTAATLAIGSASLVEAELEMLDGVTAGTVAASKAVVVNADKDISSFRNLTATGAVTAGSLVIGSADISEAELETIDGVTAGTVAASKAVVVNADKDISSFRNLTATGAVTAGSLVIGSADISEAELETIDGVTAGTVAASKAVVVNADKDISSFRNLTATGAVTAGSLVIGSADISEAELETIDGITAGTVAASKALVVDSNKKLNELNIDNITVDGNTISTTDSNGNLLLTPNGTGDVVLETDRTTIQNTADGSAGPWIILDHITASPAISDTHGLIGVGTTDAGGNAISPFTLYVQTPDLTSGAATGKAVILIKEDGAAPAYLTLDGDAEKVILGKSTDITGGITATGAVTAGSLVIGSADISETELETIDGITAGTVAASKAVVVDANKDVTGFRNLTMTGGTFTTGLSTFNLLASFNSSHGISCSSYRPPSGVNEVVNFLSSGGDQRLSFQMAALPIQTIYQNSTTLKLKTTALSTARELSYPDASGTLATTNQLITIDGVTAGTVSASKALIVDSNKKLNELLVDNITIDGDAVKFINNQNASNFASITSTHLTSSSSTLELRSEGAALTLNSGGSTIPLEYDGTQRGYLKLDTADTIKFYTGTGTGTLSTTISGDDLTVVGAISKGSGSFKIDHPIPSKKDTHHLVHSFLEGPQADLIYRGVVNLVGGSASVNIDTAARMTTGTFVLLCGNVQSFTSNESGWTAVKSSVSGNTLTITAQDNTCTDSVSWMVVGERKDQHMLDTNWTDENGRVIVEPEKQMEE